MTYVISDIHGCYNEFMELLDKISFSQNDILYVLGDVIDRGEDSIKCLKYVMGAPNIRQIMGNHDQMMVDALTCDFEYNDSQIAAWLSNGGDKVLPEFCNLPEEEQIAIIDYITSLPLLEQVCVNGQNYVLVHAGLNVARVAPMGGVSTAGVLSKQRSDDLVWIREKFFRKKALPKSITIFGHTPIPMIDRLNSAKVWRDKNFNDKIGIDGGCVYGGHLLALRLDDMAEFAVKGKRNVQ